MASVSFKIVSKENESGFIHQGNVQAMVPAYKDGQIIFVEGQNGNGRIFLDFHNTRTCYTPSVSSSSSTSGMNYVGISSTDPKTGVTIDGQPYEPNEFDMVVYGKKEYMYRHGKDEDGHDLGLGWYEIGNEASPEWEE